MTLTETDQPFEPPFDYRFAKDDKILIYRKGKLIMTFTKEKARKLKNKMAGKTEKEIQFVLAKATGQYKYGNEKENKHPN